MTQLYTNYDEWAINLMMALPCITGMVACLVSGKLCDMVDKKTIFNIGLILYLISGTNLAGYGFTSQIIMIIIANVAGGICYGMVSTAAIGIISDCYEDEEMRSKVVGWYNGAMAIIGTVFGLVCGFLASVNWKLSPAANWITLPIIILAFLFVPKCPPRAGNAGEAENVKVQKTAGWFKPLLPILFSFVIIGFVFYVISGYIDLYVSGYNLGDSALTGIATAIQTGCSFLACTFFGFTYDKLKTKISIPAYILMAASILLMYFFPNKAIFLIANGLLGFGWGSMYTFWFFRTTVVVPENLVGTATGVVTTANSLAGVLVPYVAVGLMGVMKTENFGKTLIVYGVVLVAAAILAIVTKIGKKAED
jgi:MFS family permease